MLNVALRLIVIPFIYGLSYLPMPILYLKSTSFYVLVYYILGYRKKVVFENLQKSFPQKSEKELKLIAKNFYKHFCDVIFETIKASTISKEQLIKRCYFTPNAHAIFNAYEAKKQSIVVVMGHCANWEWNVLSYQTCFKQTLLGVYHPLSNKVFDAFIYKMRSRFGGTIISQKEFYPFLIKNKSTNYSLGLIADQSPPPESAYWTTFLNQDTAVFNGPSKIARKFNYPMVYVHAIRVKRGVYEVDVKMVCENPKAYTEAEITDKHLKLLEDNILLSPADWLWSHRRWKHKKPT